jgi:hypothetical protein
MEDETRTSEASTPDPAVSESAGRSRWGEILWGDPRRYWRVAWLAPLMLFVLTGRDEPPADPPARAVVALPNEEGTVTVAWRLLASDPETVAFHVHRRDVYAGPDYERITESPVAESTTWVDAGVRHGRSYRYRVHALIDDGEVPPPTPPTSPRPTGIGPTSPSPWTAPTPPAPSGSGTSTATASSTTSSSSPTYRELRNPHELAGPGTHGLIAADVDGNGHDELILGATALDDDGSVLWESGLWGIRTSATWPTSTRTTPASRFSSASSLEDGVTAWR